MNKPIKYEKKERSIHKSSHSIKPNSPLPMPSLFGNEKLRVGGKVLVDFIAGPLGTVEGKADVRLLFRLPAWIFFGLLRRIVEFLNSKSNTQG